mgnify:CR=1 FL=1
MYVCEATLTNLDMNYQMGVRSNRLRQMHAKITLNSINGERKLTLSCSKLHFEVVFKAKCKFSFT